jgi:thioredoxin-like negative regulator of GroEL
MTQKARNNLMIVIAGLGILFAITLQRNHTLQQMEAGFAKISVVGQGKPVLLELGGQGCPACGQMIPILDQINKNYSQFFTVAYHDVWKDPATGGKYGISAIPTQIFIDKEGKELFRHEGILSQNEILAKWKELGIEIPR